MPVFVQALLEDPSAQIIGLALHHLLKRLTKFAILDTGLACRLGDPRGIEGPRSFLIVDHADM
jgi:hypothetical protein